MNTASKSERAALANSTGATTYHSQASAQIALEQTGRFAALAQERAANPTVAGAEPFVRYPGGAAWTRDQNMLEPPLGIDVNAMEPTGEAHEVAASLSAIEKATSAPSPGDAALGAAPVDRPHQTSSSSLPSAAAAHERLAELLPRIATIRRLR